MVVSGCLAGRGCIFSSFCSGRLGKEGLVPHTVGGAPAFIVSLLKFNVGMAQLSGHKLEGGAGHRSPDFGGLSHP